VAALVEVYGQVGIGLPIIVSIVAILMGLNCGGIAFPVTILWWVGVDFKDLPRECARI